MFFCAIPDALCSVILEEWCGYKCAAKMDSALCNGMTRKWFLGLLSQIQFKTDGEMSEWSTPYLYHENFYKWIVVRCVQLVAALVSTPRNNFDLLLTSSEIVSNQIQHLTFSGEFASVQTLVLLIHKCSKLISLHLNDLSDILCNDLLQSINSNTLAQLTSLISPDSPINPQSIKSIALACRIYLVLKSQ